MCSAQGGPRKYAAPGCSTTGKVTAENSRLCVRRPRHRGHRRRRGEGRLGREGRRLRGSVAGDRHAVDARPDVAHPREKREGGLTKGGAESFPRARSARGLEARPADNRTTPGSPENPPRFFALSPEILLPSGVFVGMSDAAGPGPAGALRDRPRALPRRAPSVTVPCRFCRFCGVSSVGIPPCLATSSLHRGPSAGTEVAHFWQLLNTAGDREDPAVAARDREDPAAAARHWLRRLVFFWELARTVLAGDG